MTREKMDFEKSVKRTSIKRNSQLKMICEDVTDSQKSSKLQTHISPLPSSLTSHPGIAASTRSDDKPVSVDSPCRQRDKTTRASSKDKVQVADHTRSLSHENEVSTFILSTSPPPTVTYENDRKLKRIEACTNQDSFLEPARAKSKGKPNMRVQYTSRDYSDESSDNYEAVEPRSKLIHPAVANNAKTASSSKVMQSTKCTSSSETGYFRPHIETPRETAIKKSTRISPMNSGHARQCKVIHEPAATEGGNTVEKLMSGMYVSSSLSSNVSARNYSTTRRRFQRCYKTRMANDASNKIPTKHSKDCRGLSVPEISYLMPRGHVSATPDKPLVQPAVSFPVAVNGNRMLPNVTHINQQSPHLCYCNRQGPHIISTSSFDDESKYDDTYSFRAPARETAFTQNHFQAKQIKHTVPRQDERANEIYRHTQEKTGLEAGHKIHNKMLVSKETQYSDLEAGRLQNIARKNGVRTSKIVQCTVDAAGNRKVSSATHRGSNEIRGTDRGTSPMKHGLAECELISSGNSEFVIKDSRCEKNVDRMTSDSTNGGFKCDSLLQDILKTVTKKLCGPSFQNDSSEKVANQVTKKSSQKWCAGQPCSSKGEADTKRSHISNIVPVEKSSALRSCDTLQYMKSSSSSVDHLQNNEPSSAERSTLSLEVQSVNLSFCCANKHIKNSSRQIKIKWSACPDTNSRWKTEKIVVDTVPDCPKKVAPSLCHGIREENTQVRKLENKPAASSSVIKNDLTGKHHTGTKHDRVSPERVRLLSTKPSNTTLRSPSPSKVDNCPRKRKSRQTRNENVGKDYDVARISNSTDAKPQGLMANGVQECSKKTLQAKSNSSATKSHNASDSEVRYKHKRAVSILARKTTDNMVPRTEDRSLLLHLDWGVFIIVVTTIPLLLFLLSLNFFLRASTTEEDSENSYHGDNRRH